MDENGSCRNQKELEALERERARIDEQLRGPTSPTVEQLLHAERRWVERKRRELERTRISARAALLHFDDAALPAWVHDVSAHGIGIEIDLEPLVDLPQVGEAVGLELADLPGSPMLRGIVRHLTGARIGIEFELCAAVREAAAELERRFAIDPRPEAGRHAGG